MRPTLKILFWGIIVSFLLNPSQASAAAPVFGVNDTTPQGNVGSLFYYKPTATNAASFSAIGTFPPGLGPMDPGTGVITGFPTGLSTEVITIQAHNSDGTSAYTITITISGNLYTAPAHQCN